MNTIKKTLLLFAALVIIGNSLQAQNQAFEPQQAPLDPVYFHVFDKDSLKGFDEPAARKYLLDNQYYGREVAIAMYHHKREYIKQKYNIVSAPVPSSNHRLPVARTVVAGCINEDFEASASASITSSGQIAGWSVFSGSIVSSQNLCNIEPAMGEATGISELIDCSAPGGYIDPTIGPAYPLYSVFGSGAPNANAAAVNPQVSTNFFGNKILRLNNYGAGSDNQVWGGSHKSKETLVKTFAVTPQNALFRFAYISVMAPGHSCCDGSGSKLNMYANGNPIACPAFSIYAPSSSCLTGNAQDVQYYIGGSGTNSGNPYNPATNNAGGNNVYNKWRIMSVDLTQYIGGNVTFELTAYDCNVAGHLGYIYVDAQCGPMTITGNGKEFETTIAVTPSVNTCGAYGATLCAADGMEFYAWAGPGLPAGAGVPSPTNQCITTTLSATYTLYFTPPGACGTFTRLVQTTVGNPPVLLGSNVQASCGQTISTAALQANGSLLGAPGSFTITWNPPPSVSLSQNSLTGTYLVPPPMSPATQVTVTAIDTIGCFTHLYFTVNPTVPLPTFTVYPSAGTMSITCDKPVVDLVAVSNYTYGTLNIHWVGPNVNTTGTVAPFAAPGNVTVTVKDVAFTCAVDTVLTIGINTVAPTANVSPSLQSINCSNPFVQTVTLTATGPMASNPNLMHVVSSSVLSGSMAIGTGSQALYNPVAQNGTNAYDYWLINSVSGCSTHATFTVTTSADFPTFSISSTGTLSGQGNYTVGCSPSHHLNVINIVNPNTMPMNGGGMNFGFLPPGSTSTVTNMGPSQSTVVSIPGTWTVLVNDISNNCIAFAPVTIVQNTISPDRSVIVPLQVLDCFTPSITLMGQTTNSAAAFAWLIPGGQTQPGENITINTTTNIASSIIGNYTLEVTDQNNGCKSYSVVPMQQNLYRPVPKISVTTNTITCTTPTLQLSNSSTSGITPASGFATNKIIQVQLWDGPSPQQTVTEISSYVAAVPGVYTMTVKDLNNGCNSTTTLQIQDGRVYPVFIPSNPFVLDCGAKTTSIFPAITASLAYTYSWFGPETNTFVGSTTNKTVNVSSTGEYAVLVTNPTSGCATTGTLLVVDGNLTGGFIPSKTHIYAGEEVVFTNTTTSSLGNTSITSVWSYGNGDTDTYTDMTSGRVKYTQPGKYMVLLYTTKGPGEAVNCRDIDTAYITVDIPSKLDVPNVFTPNGDGVNDVFFLKAANLISIEMVIYDRWGHMVYEVTSETGNIAWDGKNIYGKDAAAGTYFYILKAKGKDDKDYDQKGTITLAR